jgi:hypothetical protein
MLLLPHEFIILILQFALLFCEFLEPPFFLLDDDLFLRDD